MMPLTMIVAMARNGVIGKDGSLPWRIPEDLRFFRQATLGHTLIVGRRTYETLPPLPGRHLTVVSRQMHLPPRRGEPVFVQTIQRSIAASRWTDPEPIVIGGAQVYRAAMPHVTSILLTEIDRDVDGDTRLELDLTGFREVARAPGQTEGVTFLWLERE